MRDNLPAVRNGPSTLYRLVFDGTVWAPEVGGGWDAGKTLRYPGGTGGPDAEDVTRAEPGSSAIYVATERDNDNGNISRPSILRFDGNQTGGELVATHEWNLASDLPVVGANLGLEAITWIPDSFLVAFFDAAAGRAYDPALYPGHGTGQFFVGLEATGGIFAYALDHVGGGFTRIATIASGDPSSKALTFDRDTGYLWAHCGVPCGNQTAVLAIDATVGSPTFGRFAVLRRFARASTMPDLANEGIAIAPDTQCAGGFKDYFWADDGETSGHSLRRDSIPCGSHAVRSCRGGDMLRRSVDIGCDRAAYTTSSPRGPLFGWAPKRLATRGDTDHGPQGATMKVSVIDEIKIQARVLVPLIKALQAELGEERANALVRNALGDMYRKLGDLWWRKQGARSFGEKVGARFEMLAAGGALDYEVVQETPDAIDVNVTGCRYAKFFQELGVPELGFMLVCDPDFPLTEGFGPDVQLTRTQTIMQGASHCDFRYSIKKQDPET